MEKKRLVYWAKYNQYYKIIAVDNGSKTVKMIVSKRDKSVTRDMIARVELCPEWQFVIMKNKYISAEENFVNSMRCKAEYARKINELMDFKRHGLMDSEIAMKELNYIFHQGFRNVKSKQDRHFRNKVKTLYEDLMTEQTKNDNKKSYDQIVPSEIISLAKDKGLLIERNDDYITKKGSRVKPTKKELVAIRGQKPCGYLIRGKDKKAIAGFGYKFTSKQVVEFVQKYTPYNNERKKFEMEKKYEEFNYVVDAETGIVYRVIFNRHSDNTLIIVKTEKKSAKNTMDDVRDAGYNIEIKEFKRKETPFEWFYRMSQSERVTDRRTATKFDSIEGIQEINIVIDLLKEMIKKDSDTEVIRNATDSLKRLGKIKTEEVVIAPISREETEHKIISATSYEELIKALDGRLNNKKQKKLEKREAATEIPLEVIKKIKLLGSNVCVVKSSGKGFNIARYPACKTFYTVKQLDEWLDSELNKIAEGANTNDK